VYIVFLGALSIIFTIAAIIVIIYILSKSDVDLGSSVRFYYRLVPLDDHDISLDKFVLELGKKGVYAKRSEQNEVVIDEFIHWRIRFEEIEGRKYLSVEAGVKTWYLIITLLLLAPYLVLGVLMAVIGFWRFTDRQSIIRSTLMALTGDPRVAGHI
jgi:hypothetical protein